MRYRITIEIDTEANRTAINQLAREMFDVAVTKWSNPVYLATEAVDEMMLRERRSK